MAVVTGSATFSYGPDVKRQWLFGSFLLLITIGTGWAPLHHLVGANIHSHAQIMYPLLLSIACLFWAMLAFAKAISGRPRVTLDQNSLVIDRLMARQVYKLGDLTAFSCDRSGRIITQLTIANQKQRISLPVEGKNIPSLLNELNRLRAAALSSAAPKI